MACRFFVFCVCVLPCLAIVDQRKTQFMYPRVYRTSSHAKGPKHLIFRPLISCDVTQQSCPILCVVNHGVLAGNYPHGQQTCIVVVYRKGAFQLYRYIDISTAKTQNAAPRQRQWKRRYRYFYIYTVFCL